MSTGIYAFRADRTNEEVINLLREWSKEQAGAGNNDKYELKIKHSSGNPAVPDSTFALFDDVTFDDIEKHERWLPDMLMPDQTGLFILVCKSLHTRVSVAGNLRLSRPGPVRGPAEFKRFDCFDQPTWVGPLLSQLAQPRQPAHPPAPSPLMASPLLSNPLANPPNLTSTPLPGAGVNPAMQAQLDEMKLAQRLEGVTKAIESKVTGEISKLASVVNQLASKPVAPPKSFAEEMTPLAGLLIPLLQQSREDAAKREMQIAEWRREDERRREEREEKAEQRRREEEIRREEREEKERAREREREKEDKALRLEEQKAAREAARLERERDKEILNANIKMLETQGEMVKKMSDSSYQSTVRLVELQSMIQGAGKEDVPSPLEKAIGSLGEAASKYVNAMAFTKANPPPAAPVVAAAQPVAQQAVQAALNGAPAAQAATVAATVAPTTPGAAQVAAAAAGGALPPMRGVVAKINMMIRNKSPVKDVASTMVSAFMGNDADLLAEQERHGGNVDAMVNSRLGDWVAQSPANQEYIQELMKQLAELFQSNNTQPPAAPTQQPAATVSTNFKVPTFAETGRVVELMNRCRTLTDSGQTAKFLIDAYDAGNEELRQEAIFHEGDIDKMILARMTAEWRANPVSMNWLKDMITALDVLVNERSAQKAQGAPVAPPATPHPADA